MTTKQAGQKGGRKRWEGIPKKERSRIMKEIRAKGRTYTKKIKHK